MNRRIWIILFFSSIHTAASGQVHITGTVTGNKGEAVPFASLALSADSTGTTTDSAGHFDLQTKTQGRQMLTISSMGYKTAQQALLVQDTDLHLSIVLRAGSNALHEVIVSAGSFEASDKAKGASLTPIDAVTVAGSSADISLALRALPGAQQIGEQEGLFVRGGTGDETKQFIDGTLLKNPNYPSVPGIQQYARVNPFLFKGILFNTGGYSALYGQAMSSALILESIDLPEKSSASLSLFSANAGVGVQQLIKNNRGSYGVNLRYSNQAPYNAVVPQRPDYFSGPEYLEGDANFRLKIGKAGMLKFYTNWSKSEVGMTNPDIDSAVLRNGFRVEGKNVYNNLSYRDRIGTHWKIDAGLAYSYNRNHTTTTLSDDRDKPVYIAREPFNSKQSNSLIESNFAQARIVLSRSFPRSQALRFGGEHFYTSDQGSMTGQAVSLTDQLSAFFAEGDLRVTDQLAARLGARAEYSNLTKQATLAPRMSVAYRLGDGSQLNFAYGIFYQEPPAIYLYRQPDLSPSCATHYVLNYTRKANNRFFRVEAYYKQYDHLLKTVPVLHPDGSGHAQGLELFWRDKKSVKNLDYWISYTYLDTRRDFLDNPYELEPSFAARHTATVAIKKFFPSLSTNINLSYAFASGRPYYDIRDNATGTTTVYDQGTTRPYHVVNLHVAYLTSFFGHWKHKDFSGIAFGVNNLLGTDQVFGYQYSFDGRNKIPVTLPAARYFFVGVFMSLGIDRTADFLNNDNP